MIMNVGTQVLFESPIEDLRLAVRLRVVRGAHAELCATEFE